MNTGDGVCKNACNNSPINTARFSPQSGQPVRERRRRVKRLRSLHGPIELSLWHGREGSDGQWGCPLLESWGIRAHQQWTPAARRRLALTAATSLTYAEAAELMAEWGLPVEDSTLHALVQKAGAEADQQTQRRLETPPATHQVQAQPTELLNLMIDGCQIRFRGPGWGHPRSGQAHVEWHELKLGVCYRQENALVSKGRGLLSQKRLVSWRGEGAELCRRLHWEAQAQGLALARRVRTVNDGAPWIWSLVQDRWPQAEQVLDFYHASGHLHALAEALHSGDETAARIWVKPRRARLRRGNAVKLLDELAELAPPEGEAGAVVRREQNYLACHAGRMDYRQLSQSGPIGSGAIESACRSRQCRFKRPGQFWTDAGLRNLCALQEARRNGHWDTLWKS